MKSLIVCALFFIFLSVACKKSGPTLTPAQAIEGRYTAFKYIGIESLYYPINGKTITMQIDAIGQNSVRLQMRSVENGFYSPGDTVIDLHLLVQKLPYSSYQVTLGDPVDSGTDENTIEFNDSWNRYLGVDPGYLGYYIYVPPGFKQGEGAVETIFTKTQ